VTELIFPHDDMIADEILLFPWLQAQASTHRKTTLDTEEQKELTNLVLQQKSSIPFDFLLRESREETR
jgi:hypothetical protein